MGKKRPAKGNLGGLENDLAAAKAEIAVLTRIIESLVEKSHGQDPAKVVESLLTGLAPLFLGYRDQKGETKAKVADLGNIMAGLDETAGTERGVWFPDVEFDESMEPRERWPEPGTISGTSQDPTIYRMTPNGVERTDGQQMFQAGQTAPPPDSATE